MAVAGVATGRRGSRRLARLAVLAAGVVLGVGLMGGGGLTFWAVRQMRASLPILSGAVTVAGLAGEVTVERDALGVPVIRGGTREDVARALGFLHAQDRYFQMDLLRRRAAGELAELFGPAALDMDREVRVHRFRSRASTFLSAAEPAQRRLLAAYAEGVAAGLAALGAAPFEYLVLRVRPEPWQPEDSVLAVLAMYLDLQGFDLRREAGLGVLYDTLPTALAEFLTPRGTAWDAPLAGGVFTQPPPPGPEVLDLRTGMSAAGRPAAGADGERLLPGSNNWAVAGGHTAHGGALVANDMHLGLGVPPHWYRAQFRWPDPLGGGERSVVGATLPGTPAMVVGSNTRVAWGFTNSYGDWLDLVVLETSEDRPGHYLAPDGWRSFQEFDEVIEIKGRPAETLAVRETIWGPVVDQDHRGRWRALRWVAHDGENVAFHLMGMETVADLDEAAAVAARGGIPAQNMVAADVTGRIGWMLSGRIPNRRGCDGRLPASWADGACGWDGYLPAESGPRVLDPPSGRVWTANARVVDGDALALVGDGGYDLGARAGQIRDALFALDRATEADMLALQLDDRALFLERWRGLLADVLDRAPAGDPFDAARDVLAGWEGRAAVHSASYRLVRAWRGTVADLALEPLAATAREVDEDFLVRRVGQWEGPLWELLEARPEHLLSPDFENWDHLLRTAVERTVAELTRDGARLADQTWGRRNTVRARHPLSRALPWVAAWLDMPMQELPGDMHMPRVQGVGFGASQRMAVSPGREELGFFHLPGGQSGHPFSPHYRDSYPAWAAGEATPLLPGAPIHTLRLIPPGV